MKVIYGFNKLKKRSCPSAVSVGVFDGVHIGHQKVIRQLLRQARFLKAKPVVVTFEPHPAKVLKQGSLMPMLASLKHRLSLLEGLGVEGCVVIRFNEAFAQKSAGAFIQRLLIDRLNMKALILGEGFSFGKEQLREIGVLRALGKALGFKLVNVKSRRHNSRIISSSLIRHMIERGRIKEASRLLDRPFSIWGTVVKGRQRGRTIGFKTANIDPHHEAIPPSGVYAAYTRLGRRVYKSVLNIGRRPTFDEKEPVLEVHLFGFSGRLYGRSIEVIFKKRLRPERRFGNKLHLREQIIRDASLARSIL